MLTGTFQSTAILDFLDQQEKFASSATCVTKLTLATKAAFIHKILCFEVFKILFSQLVDRMLENKILHECENLWCIHCIFGLTHQEWSLT